MNEKHLKQSKKYSILIQYETRKHSDLKREDKHILLKGELNRF